MSQENNIVLSLEAVRGAHDEAALRDAVCAMSGVEFVAVDAARGSVSVIGADLSRDELIERIEALGYTVY